MSASSFSYAQAARGQSTSQQNTQLASSSATSTPDPLAKDDVPAGSITATAPALVYATEGPNMDNNNNTKPVSESGLSKQGPAMGVQDNHIASIDQQASKAVQEDAAVIFNTPQASEGKNSRSTSRTSRTNDASDGKKSRKGKKGKAQDKDVQSEQAQEDGAEKEPVKPVVLTEAAPPAVNPWSKRAAEVFQGKDKTAAAQLVTSPVVGSELKKRTLPDNGEPQPVMNGVHSDKSTQKKTAEGPRATDQASRRNAPRGARATDKDEKNAAPLPAVSDSSAWPEPKAAATQELPVRKAQEKSEASDKDGQDEAAPARKKTWEKIDINHSVVFQSMPAPRSTKPRGGARGGRDQATLRGHPNGNNSATSPTSGAATEKISSGAGSTKAQPTTAHPREGSVAARSSSQAQSSMPTKRASVDGSQRKPSVSANAENTRDEIPTSSRRYTKDIRTDSGQLSPEGAHASSRTVPQERPKEVVHGAVNGHHHQYPAREGRPERGRGNGYRHRGGHNGGAVGTHAASSSFSGNGHYGPQGGFRQNSSTHGAQALSGQFTSSFGHQGRGRAGKWTGSNGQSSRNVALASSFAPKAQQANEFAVNAYGPAPYAYQQQFLPAIVPVLIAQIEYYFSVENLCKDLWLRKHMDGAGFVRLDFIAQFHRVKKLTEDINLLRMACLCSPNVLLVWDEHGIERLRAGLPNFEQFILPEAERADDYKNNGPERPTPHSWQAWSGVDTQTGVPQPYPGIPFQQYPAYPQEQMFQHQFSNGGHYDYPVNGGHMNGGQVNGYHHGHETQLSAVVPEFTPPEEPVTLESMTNISDSQIEKLVVVLVTKEDDNQSSTPSVAGYVAVQPQHELNGESHNPPNEAHVEQPIIWLDGDSDGQHSRQSYTSVREAALNQRRNAQVGVTPREMEELYRFWSTMLLNHFNAKVYEQFRVFAFQDIAAQQPLRCGLDQLIGFYDKLLLDTEIRKPWPVNRAVPSVFVNHYAEAKDLLARALN